MELIELVSPRGVGEVDLMVRFEVNGWDLALGMDQEWIVTVTSCNTHKPLLISFQPVPDSSNHFHHLHMTS